MSGTGVSKPNSNSLPIGYRFNEFEIKEAIGEGGFGIVYRAYDHQLERTIAIKEYMPTSLAMRNDDLSIGLRGERFSKTFQAGEQAGRGGRSKYALFKECPLDICRVAWHPYKYVRE